MTTRYDPIERKVQLTGGSTYTVSLPKEWANDQQIEPGSPVTLYVRDDKLVVTRDESASSADRTASIDATNREPAALALDVGAAYVAGCDEINVDGFGSTTERRAVTRAIRRFVGLEVMTEDEQSLTARTMLDAADLSPEQTLAQLERTAMEMHADAITAVIETDGELGDRIARQDDTVDRLFSLISRGFQRSLVDPSVGMSRNGLRSFEYYMAARQLERVADHAEKIAEIAGRLESPPPAPIADSLEAYGRDARQIVTDSLAGLFEDSPEPASVIADADELLAEIEAFDEELYHTDHTDSYLLGVVLDSIVRTTQYGVNIAESALQARYRTTIRD
ncbi:MAG: PhoU domain-containing protein [Halovenus sp.]